MTTLVNGLSQPFAALQALLRAEEAGKCGRCQRYIAAAYRVWNLTFCPASI